MYKTFQEMPIWQETMELAEQVFHLTTNLPRSEDYGLTSQIRRSASSVAANIAEAFGRFHKNDKITFYYYASGSNTETQNHLIYGARVKYFPKDTVEELVQKYEKLRHKINKIIKTLKGSKKV